VLTAVTLALAPRRCARWLGLAPVEVRPTPPAARPWTDALVRRTAGRQRCEGVPIDQVDGTTCGAAVLVVLRAALDGVYRAAVIGSRLEPGRFGAEQLLVHRQSTRWWPRALGTSPWGMAGWLRHSGVVSLRVQLVDAADTTDQAAVLARVDAALAAGWAVPLLVGSLLPRHWCLALPGAPEGGWLVYEPSSASVRRVPPQAVRQRNLRPLLGFDDLQAVLLPAGPAVSGSGGPRRVGRPSPLLQPREDDPGACGGAGAEVRGGGSVAVRRLGG
jgi:hypothetical protein